MIGLSTGRETSQRLNSLLKELAHTIPRARIVRRGKSGLDDLARRMFNDGVDYGLILQRWHGGPGRMDFFKVQTDALDSFMLSLILNGVKLRREYPNPRRAVAQAVSCDEGISETAHRLVLTLCNILGLPEMRSPADPGIKTTLHIGQLSGGMIRIAVTSPPRLVELGPSLLVSRLIWDSNA